MTATSPSWPLVQPWVYSQRGLEHELKAVEPSMMIELPMDDRHFYRVEVWDAQGDITAITNPIFIAHN